MRTLRLMFWNSGCLMGRGMTSASLLAAAAGAALGVARLGVVEPRAAADPASLVQMK